MNTCNTCGEYLRTHDDHSGQYCPSCQCPECTGTLQYNEDIFQRGLFCNKCSYKDVEQFEKAYIVDVADRFILFKGKLDECQELIDTYYGGLTIFHEWELPENLTNIGEYQ
jgi:hypothetical protein